MKLDDILSPFSPDFYPEYALPPPSSPGHPCGAPGDFWRRRLPKLQQPIPHRRAGRLLSKGLMKETRQERGLGQNWNKISDKSAINTIENDIEVRMTFDN